MLRKPSSLYHQWHCRNIEMKERMDDDFCKSTIWAQPEPGYLYTPITITSCLHQMITASKRPTVYVECWCWCSAYSTHGKMIVSLVISSKHGQLQASLEQLEHVSLLRCFTYVFMYVRLSIDKPLRRLYSNVVLLQASRVTASE